MNTQEKSLGVIVDDVLIESMSPGLKGAIEDMLAKGYNRVSIAHHVRRFVKRGSFTDLAIQAYLDKLLARSKRAETGGSPGTEDH